MISKENARRSLETHAPGLLPLVRADPTVLEDALARPLELPSDRESLGAELWPQLPGHDGPALRRALRRFRHRAVVRIALREIERLAGIEQTAAEMAHLASVMVDAALEAGRTTEMARHGACEVPLTALGMGKLGGLELNLGSDVDLVFFYESDDAQVEGGQTTVHELYSRVVRRCTQILSEITEDGFCFRVDLRLRPEGTQGPLVNSLASAERYYESWGRTWERAALARARPIAGDRDFGRRLLDALRPFVYRRAVDPSIATAMHEMLLRSRRELSVDERRDVKLGRGGIREAEFFVQSLQLIWGGRHRELQVAGTLEALRRLGAAGLVTDREAEVLKDAWTVLRRVEHRIHVWSGYQTHTLPRDSDELERFATSLGYDDAQGLDGALSDATREVAALFATLLPGTETEAETHARWDALLDRVANDGVEGIAAAIGDELGVHEPFEAATHLARLARRANGPFGAVTSERLPALGRMLLSEVAGTADPDSALSHLAAFFDRLGGAFPYERLLLEQPRTTRRLLGLFGASGTLSSALVGHPEDLDLLLESEAPTEQEIREAHETLRGELPEVDDPEALVADLRRLKRTFTLQIGLAYVAGETDLSLATDRLSELAEAQVRVSLDAATRWARARSGDARDATLMVAAMGKLGGRELGFGGDLDLVFLYDRDGETVGGTTYAELFTRVAQRTMMLLRQRDAEGIGYEMDTRLRPSGSKGTLVVSLAAFDRYHERGAAAWERQALIRARPIAGDSMVGEEAAQRFVRLAYLTGPTPPEELAHLRGRLQRELAGENPARYHPKLGYGGLTDVELLVQWLQMRHGGDVAVRTPSTSEAIDRLAAIGVLGANDADALRGAYDFLRRVELALKLHDAHREPRLEPRGRTGTHVARLLGLHARDGLDPVQTLESAYRQHASRARALFEEHVGPVDAAAPWEASA